MVSEVCNLNFDRGLNPMIFESIGGAFYDPVSWGGPSIALN